MKEAAKSIPEGYHTVTPTLTVKDANKALEFYQKAFGAEIIGKMPGPDGRGIMHAEFKIGNSILMMGEEMQHPGSPKSPESLGGVSGTFYIYVQDSDALFNKAVAAGGKVTMPMADMFWGDRAGSIVDPFGHMWMIGTRKRDLTPEEMKKGAEQFLTLTPKVKKRGVSL